MLSNQQTAIQIETGSGFLWLSWETFNKKRFSCKVMKDIPILGAILIGQFVGDTTLHCSLTWVCSSVYRISAYCSVKKCYPLRVKISQ